MIYITNEMNLIINDVPTPLGIYYQDSGTPNQEGILELHDTIIFYLLLVLGLVS
jgi:cytochrome c oxidase subunit 2